MVLTPFYRIGHGMSDELLKEIKRGVETANRALGDPAALGEGITQAVDSVLDKLSDTEPTGDLFKIVVRAIEQCLKDAELLKIVAGLVGRHSPDLVRAVAQPFSAAAGKDDFDEEALSQKLAAAFAELARAVGGPLFNGPTGSTDEAFNAIPSALRESLFNALLSAQELKEFLRAFGKYDNLRQRLDAVQVSLEALFKLMQEGEQSTSLVDDLLKKFVKYLAYVMGELKGREEEWDPQTPAEDRIKQLVVFALTSLIGVCAGFIKILESASRGQAWNWFDLPTGLQPGELYAWLNDESTYKNADKLPFVKLQRLYRTRMVSAVDAWVRERFSDQQSTTPLGKSDQEITQTLVGSIISLFLDNTLGFIFEPECLPFLDVDLPGFEDIGIQFADVIAKQLRVILRSLIGTSCRGVWEFSFHTEALCELAATVISVAFSGVLRGVCINLTWEARIVGRYPGDKPPPELTPRPYILLDGVESMERIEGTGEKLQYVAVLRLPGKVEPEGYRMKGKLADLLKDFATYLDVCYQQFRIGSRFTAATKDQVTISRAELRHGYLWVEANSSLQTDAAEWPMPILRVYWCCEVAVMTRPRSPADPYTLQLNIDESVHRERRVVVLSNRGGTAATNVEKAES